MTKRLVLVALVVATALALAAPAMAFNGYRSTYVISDYCSICHSAGNQLNAPAVQEKWAATTHAQVGDPAATANAEPLVDGPRCAGCHSSNYDPQKHIPDAAGEYPHEVVGTQGSGSSAFSEPFISCSACHGGVAVSGALNQDLYGSDPSDSAHSVPMANMASADICGQCHSRYSASTVPYLNYDGTSATREYTIGTFNPLGTPANGWMPQPITDFLNIPTPDAPQSMVYYRDGDGELLPWSARGHEEGAAQYNEWAMEGHADALDGLIADMGGRLPFLTSCLECHSADHILGEEGEKPTIANAKYGVTCQVCHDPHEQSEQTSLWNEERNPQLTAPREELCVECHNAELEAGETATPGSDVHHPMKEIMEGRGAIGVPQGSPSVHKDKCVDCHMVPTQYDRFGVPMTGANHVFAIVEPEVAAESLSTADIGGAQRPLPYSSCSSCHGRASDPYATYLTGTFENRQAQMQAWDLEVGDELTAAAARMGYGSIAAAHAAINNKAQADWTASELAFMSAYTNRTYIESEGSWGIHNWDYARTVILKAVDQAKSVKSSVVDVSIGSPLVTAPYGTAVLKYGQSTTISGKVELPAGADTATLLGAQVRLWFKPTGGAAAQPIQQVFTSGPAFNEYLFTVMPTRSGIYTAQFVGNDAWETAVSLQTIGLDVKYRVTISRPKTNVKLNASVKFKGSVAPVDFEPGTVVQIQRKKGTGAWKNWVKVGAGENGVYSFTKKMKATGTYRFRAVFAADVDHLTGTSNTVKVVVKR